MPPKQVSVDISKLVTTIRAACDEAVKEGVSPDAILIGLVRLGACSCMDAGMNEDEYVRFAAEQYSHVPLARKPRSDSNVIDFESRRKG